MTESHEAFEARLRRVLNVAARELPMRQIAWEEPAAMTRRRWRPGSPLGATAMLLSVVVAAVVAVFALAVLKHGGPSHSGASGGPPPAAHGNLLPTHPSRRQQQELCTSYLRAQNAASRRDRACALAPPRRIAPSVSKGSPSAGLLAMLGVLRRPSDRHRRAARSRADHRSLESGRAKALRALHPTRPLAVRRRLLRDPCWQCQPKPIDPAALLHRGGCRPAP